MDILLQDLKSVTRVLARHRGFTAAAVLLVGLAIGIDTAVFSVVRSVLLRPLPFAAPDRLVQVWETDRRLDRLAGPVSPHNLADWRAQSETMEGFAAYSYEVFALEGTDGPERIVTTTVSAEFFALLGVEPALGRGFVADEEGPGRNRVVVLSHGLWRTRFAGDRQVVGAELSLDGRSHTVIGVMPEGFAFPSSAQMWAPLGLDLAEIRRGSHFLFAVGRMREGVGLAEAQAELDAIAARLEKEYPGTNSGQGVRLVSLHEQVVGEVSDALWLLLGAVTMVLLIGCANVANLMIARATGRRREVAVRAALGAGRGRLLRQLLLEGVLLALAAGMVGMLLAAWGIDALLAASPVRLPRADEVGIDAAVLGFSLGVALLTGLSFAMAPALQLSRAAPSEALRDSTASAGRGGRRLRGALVAAEVTLALVLLVGTALLVGSFVRLQGVDPGFRPENVLTARIALPPERYGAPESQIAFWDDLLLGLAALPGVEAAGAVDDLPFSGSRSSSSFELEGEPADPDVVLQADARRVSPDYFRALGVPLLRGRELDERDTFRSPPVVVVNRAFARRFFGDEDVLGRRLRTGSPQEVALFGDSPWREIVGVVGDLQHDDLSAEAAAEMYFPYRQNPSTRIALAVRTDGEPAELAGAVRAAVQRIDSNQPLYDVQDMEQRLAGSIEVPRFLARLAAAFAGAAVLLAFLGIYGVVAYAIGRRTRELGIRIALGAGPTHLLWLVLSEGMGWVAIGLALGSGGAIAVGWLLEGMLFEVSPTDPMTFAGTAGLLAVAALIACLVPTRRALRVDPLVALKAD